ncbi:MAG: peptidyl-prolyl cis-trans isomerase [Thermoleophilia bacterium]
MYPAGLIIILVMACLTVSSCGDLPSNAAATVNGKVISKDDVAERIRIGAGINPGKVPTDPNSEDYKNFQRDITEQLVAEEMERQEAEKRGVTVTADEVDAKVDLVVEDQYLGSLQKMQEDFAKRGITENDLRNEILRQLLHQKILDTLRAEVPVNEEEVRAQYEASRSSYIYPEKRQVRQIVTADEASALAAANKVAAGDEMASVAQQVTIDNKTKTSGGMVGLVTQASLPREVGDVAFSLALNQLSMPFKSSLGWYIIKVELITPASNRTYDQVKDDLIKFAGNQKLAERYKTYVEEVQAAYDVEYADDYSPREKTATDEITTATIPS